MGAEYATGTRVLCALESHYSDKTEEEDCKSNRNFTRTFFEDPSYRANKNMMELLCDRGYVKDNDDCLKRIAMYNVVQTPMITGEDGGRTRPTPDDYTNGWKAFGKLIEILRPDYCLIGFVKGDEYEKFFGCSLNTNETNKARTTTLTVADHTTNVIMIHHPSRPHFNIYGGCQGWHDYLKENYYPLLQKINGW